MKKPVRHSAKGSAEPRDRAGGSPAKKPTNLSLDPVALGRGEQFAQRNGTSVSQLVTRFLFSLPAEDDASTIPLEQLAPAVRRLYGVVAGRSADRAAYRVHLAEKYGGK